MHKYITKSLLTLTALMSCGLALAQPATQSNEQFYVEGGYAWMTYTDSGYSTTPGVGSVRFGANMNKNLAIEGML